MRGFRDYLESEEQDDIDQTLARLPERIRSLARDFAVSFQSGNTLNNDQQHVGVVQTHPRPHIIIAAPWRYSREVTFLHEIGHLVWAHFLDEKSKHMWSELTKHTPMERASRQSDEELFSMGFASTYAKHPPTTYYKPRWVEFIKGIGQG